MELKTLKQHIKKAASMQPSVANFSDAQSAAKNALIKHFGLEDASLRDIREHKYQIFRIIEETIDEVVPQNIKNRTGDFSEIRQFARDESVTFDIKTSHNSKRRMYKAIQRGARGGSYRAYKVDGYDLHMRTQTESVGYMITLEDILTGNRTIQELVTILADAWVEKIYVEVFQALSTAAAVAPDVNQMTDLSLTGAYNELDKIISIIKAYGQPRILGFSKHISQLDNSVASGSVYAEDDLNDIRNQGHVGKYKGTPIVELPNYLIDATNENWLFSEDVMFILPANEKPVKVAFQGDSYTKDTEHTHGGVQYDNHRMMGVTVLFNNSIGSVNFS